MLAQVFFRAGVLGQLEDMRDERLGKIIALFQGWIRGFLMRRQYKLLQDQRVALTIMQRNIRKWLGLKNWSWWRLYTKIKPMLSAVRAEEEMKKKVCLSASALAALSEGISNALPRMRVPTVLHVYLWTRRSRSTTSSRRTSTRCRSSRRSSRART